MATFYQFDEFLSQNSDQPLAYALLFSKSGSGYRQEGAKKLLAQSGQSVGLISGGCLEPEIEEAMGEVLKNRSPRFLTLNTKSPEDRFFGYGLGCEGELKIFIDFIPAEIQKADILKTYLGLSQCGFIVHQFDESTTAKRHQFIPTHGEFNESWEREGVFIERVESRPKILIVGANRDAHPVFELCRFLGWQCLVIDFRKTLGASSDWHGHFKLHRATDRLETSFNAAFVMSHNYEYDLSLLSRLIESRLQFIGLLGPEKRKLRLLEDLHSIYGLSPSSKQLEPVYGPVGHPPMGDNPHEIALSMVHHCQMVLDKNTISKTYNESSFSKETPL